MLDVYDCVNVIRKAISEQKCMEIFDLLLICEDGALKNNFNSNYEKYYLRMALAYVIHLDFKSLIFLDNRGCYATFSIEKIDNYFHIEMSKIINSMENYQQLIKNAMTAVKISDFFEKCCEIKHPIVRTFMFLLPAYMKGYLNQGFIINKPLIDFNYLLNDKDISKVLM